MVECSTVVLDGNFMFPFVFVLYDYAVFFFFRGFRCGPKEVKYSVEIQMIYLEQSLKYTLSELI